MTTHDDADAGAAAAADDEAALPGILRTQSGPRTVAPMWARPLLTEGEWSIYTALWSFGTWNGTDAWPSYQKLADRAWCERGSAINAIAKFVKLGLVAKKDHWRADESQSSNRYLLLEICPDVLVPRLMELAEERIADQAEKKAKRDADKRKYRKPRTGPAPAETTPGEGDGQGGNDVGSSPSDPTSEGLPDWAQDKGGSSRDVPVTYPSFDLSPMDQSPPTAVPTHAADAPASDVDAPTEPAEQPAAAEPVPAVEGGTFTLEDQNRLTVAVNAAVAARKTRTGWARPAVVDAVASALDDGHPVAAVVAALAEITKDPATDYPARLAPYLTAKAKRADASTVGGPCRHKPAPPCVKGCDCWKHLASAGEGTDLSDDAAAAIAAVRAKLRPGKPLSRYDRSTGTRPSTNAGTAASGEIDPESGPAEQAA